MAEEFKVIDDPNDPRLKDTPANEPAAAPADTVGAFDDLLADDEPEVTVTAPEQGGGSFDDLIQTSEEARQTFRGKRGLVLKSLQDYGASPVVQGALLGDIEQESSFNPTLSDDGGTSHGLLQIGTPMYRQYESLAAQNGWSPDSPEFTYNQVPFVLDRFKKDQPARWEAMQGMKDSAEVVEVFRGDPDWGYGIAGKRHSYADKYQSLLENGPIELDIDNLKPNASFGDLTGDEDGKPPALDYGDEQQHPIVADQQVADVEIPEFLKEPEEDKEEAAAPRARPRIAVGGGSYEIPEAFKLGRPYDLPDIPQTAAPQEQFVGTPNGPLIPTPQQPEQRDVAPSQQPGFDPLTPMQQSFVNMGQRAADWVPMEAMGNAAAAAKETASGFAPKTLPEVGNFIAENFSPLPSAKEGIKEAYGSVRDFVSGKPIDQSVLENYPGIDQIKEADKTPPFSKERFKAGFDMAAQLGGAAAGGAGLKAQIKPKPKAKISGAAVAAAEAEAGQFAGLTKEQMNELQYGRGFADVGPQRAKAELARISPEVLLRRQLRAQEKAGMKGFRRGSAEVQELEKQLERAKKAGDKAEVQGLKAKLKAEEEAGRAGLERGWRAGRMEMEKKARADAADIRETLRTADKWLDADINEVLAKLKSFSMHLPLHERGKLNDAFARVARKPPAWTRDPAKVRRVAEQVLNRMAKMVYETNKKRITKDINKGLQKIIDSPTVLLANKRLAQVMQRTFNAFKDKMSLDMLEAMHARMKEIEAQGRDLFADKERIKAGRDVITQGEITTQGTMRADTPEALRMPVGEIPTYWQEWRHRITHLPALLDHFKFTLTPMDWQFLRFDGQGIGGGALHRNLKLPIDVRYGQFMDHLDALQARRTAVKEKYKLGKKNYNRIAAHAELRQTGGADNLRARGVSEADIRKWSNKGALSEGECALLKVDDAILNELEPIIREAYERDWNHDIGPKIPGYYPRIRDWELYDSLSFEQRAQHHKMSRTESGFATQRQAGAKTKNILDSDQIMNKHLEDVLYTVNVGPEISRGAKMVKQQWFQDQVGTAGQKVFADWYDTLARNGGVESQRRIPIIDWARKNVGGAQLAFRATTILLQPTALLNTMPFLSVRNTAHGISSVLNAESRAWIMKTFPEVRASVRGSIDDPAFKEHTSKVMQAGFAPIRVMDGFARMSAVEAAYRDALEKRGIAFDRNMVPHPEAVAEAQRLVRMTQATGLAKDAPAALARGSFSRSLSLDKALLQFQNFIIHRWSLTKYGGHQLFAGNAAEGAKIMGYVILATYAEQLGREGIANSIRAIFGAGSAQDVSRRAKELETPLPLRVAEKAGWDMITSIPIVTNINGMFRYDSNGVPIADTLSEVVDGFKAAGRGQGGTALRGAQAAGALVGVPTGQIGDILVRMVRTQANEDYVGPYPSRSTGPGRSAPSRSGYGPGRSAPTRGY